MTRVLRTLALALSVVIILCSSARAQVAQAELRGTAWSVRHDGTQPLARGRRCIVERVEGLMLHVRPE